MISRAVGKLRGAVDRAATAFRSRGLVLLYHRVAEVCSDPWALAVTPEHFAEHLEILRRYCEPVPLRSLVASARTGAVADRSVAVTFDDGYADNLSAAKPLLERYAVPATIFVATGGFANPRLFWWDELDRIILQPPCLPTELRLEIAGVAHHWTLGFPDGAREAESSPDASWRGWDGPRTDRQRLFRELWQLLRPLAVEARTDILDTVGRWAQCRPEAPPAHRTLRAEEVGVLAAGEMVEIGAHTITHPTLSTIPVEAQQREIQGSKQQLENLINAPVHAFAYPHGGRSDYTRATVSIVRESGFHCACAAVDGVVVGSTDGYRLPRLYVEDWSGDEFARRLEKWLRVRIS